jgi:hypothetical protein
MPPAVVSRFLSIGFSIVFIVSLGGSSVSPSCGLQRPHAIGLQCSNGSASSVDGEFGAVNETGAIRR